MSKRQALNTIGQFLQEVKSHQKIARANTEPETAGGTTEHPIKDDDDGTKPSKELSRAKEHDKDNKEQVGEASLAATAEKGASLLKASKDEGTIVEDATESQLQIGTKKAPTGEDPATVTETAGDTYHDPGTTHPARTDNDDLDGKKYASVTTEKLAGMVASQGNDLLELIARGFSAPGDTFPTKTAEAGTKAAASAGVAIADAVDQPFDKSAFDQAVYGEVRSLVKESLSDAVNVYDFLTAYTTTLQKQAMDPAMMDPAMTGGGAPPMDPAMAGGGAPPMDPAMMGGGGGGGEEEIIMMVQQLLEAGVPPEEIMQILQQSGIDLGGEMGGGAPPMDPAAMGGEPPMDPAAMGGMEAMASAGAGKQASDDSGEDIKQADTLKKAKDYLSELIKKSHTKG